jgi:hypothetical protein
VYYMCNERMCILGVFILRISSAITLTLLFTLLTYSYSYSYSLYYRCGQGVYRSPPGHQEPEPVFQNIHI